MQPLKILSPAAQVAAYLGGQLRRGAWQGEMPGAPSMALELGVDHRTVIAAFDLLEREGVLASQGVGKRRRILHQDKQAPPALRVRILTYEDGDRQLFYIVELQHRLIEAGHVASFASHSLHGLGMDVKRVGSYVKDSEADAWVVFAGSREILEWFATQEKPVFALAGRRHGISIAGCGPDKLPAQRAVLRRFVELGHRRIVMLAREERRHPQPGYFERMFLEELESHGIRTGLYNLPDWKDDVEDFHRCLDALFRHTPPTAILIDEMQLFTAAQLHLAQLGILAPRDVSLVCTDPNPAFAWCRPSIAHFQWDASPLVRRITRWADNVARGIDDRRQSFTKAQFVEGGSIGPVPKSQMVP
jgi:DNA-binding LacI/PurR family transcriptional regulator